MRLQKHWDKATAWTGTLVLWVFFIVIGAAFGFATAIFFGPLIIVLITLIFSCAVLKYIFTRKLKIESGMEGIMAGWAIAAVFASVALVAAHLLMWLYGHAAAVIPSMPRVKDEQLYVWAAVGVLGILTAGLCAALLAGRGPGTSAKRNVQGDGFDERRNALATVYVPFSAMLLILFVAGPAGTMLTAIYRRSYSVGWKDCAHLKAQKIRYEKARWKERGWDPPVCGLHQRRQGGKVVSTCTMVPVLPKLVRIYFWLACWPALLLGFGAIRRGLWMVSIKRMVENIATSKVRSAAMGLIELHGMAQPSGGDGEILACRTEPLAGRQVKVGPFYLEDDTGRVLVDVPADCVPGDDQRVVITERVRMERDVRFHSLLPGDEVYVIGDMTTQRRDGKDTGVVSPWELPYGRFMLGFTNALFNRKWDLIGIMDLNSMLGFGFLPHIFLVCDGDEKVAKEAMFRGWKKQVIWGAAMLLSAVGLLMYVDWALPK